MTYYMVETDTKGVKSICEVPDDKAEKFLEKLIKGGGKHV